MLDEGRGGYAWSYGGRGLVFRRGRGRPVTKDEG